MYIYKFRLSVIAFLFLLGETVLAQSGRESMDPEIHRIEKTLLGSWEMENYPQTKYLFTSTGKMQRYDHEKLAFSVDFHISRSCGGESLKEGFFLVLKTGNKSQPECTYIENLNFSSNNQLVIMTSSQGSLVVLKRSAPDN